MRCGESIRKELRRFGVELLCCLLMVLYVAPLQASGAAGGQEDREFEAAPPDPPSSKNDADRDDAARGDAAQSADAAEAFEAAVAAKDHLEGIPLYPGYNLVSLPEEPPDPDPAAVFAPIAGNYVEVFAHDVCDNTDEDGWQIYDPTDPASSDLLAVDPTQGLWIEATAPAVLPSDGTLPATTSWQLCQGWNLIGFPAAQPRPVRSALQSIDGKYVRIFGYDASDTDDPWEIWDVAVPDWANDLRELRPGFGYWLLVTEDVTVEIANEGEPPTVAFTAPADLAEVTEPTEIRGTVESQLLDSWSLAYRFAGETEWTELGSGNVPVADGPLATFDPTLLLNGLYELRLRAVDFAGVAVEETMAVVVDGQMKIGHFTLSFVDLAIPLSGLDVEVVRTYDSRQRQQQGDFGHGWSLDVRQGSYRNNRPPGDGWRIPAAEGPWGLPCSTVQETKSHLTTVRLSDREVYRFRLVLENPATVTGGCFAEAAFEWVDGPLPGTTLEILGGTQVFAANGSDAVVVPDTQEPFVPEDVKLTTRDGRIFHLDLTAGVTRVEDLNGNALDITPAGITHSSGRGVDFERDEAGRIVAITDPLGQSNLYGYTEAGDLAAFTDRAEAVTRFSYGAGHFLEEVENALGVRAVRTEYDDDGRMVKMVDASGKAVSFDHDLDAHREVVTNRLGHTRVLEYDDRGNVVRETDELGHVTVRSYDGNDRLLTETDPLGNTTTNVYDADGDLTSTTDPLGHVTRFTHDARGNPTTLTDPLGNVTTFAYSSTGNLVGTTDPLGNETAFRYDDRGLLLSETDALGQTTHFSYDDAGRLISTTDPTGNVTTFAYDLNGDRISMTKQRTRGDGTVESLVTTWSRDPLGRITATTLPDGSTTATTYDLLGATLSTTDALGRVTSFTHDEHGNPTAVTHPDGVVETRSWDAEGFLVATTDRAGHTTTFARDAAGRVVEITLPDGEKVQRGHDATGRIVTSTDALGHTTVFTYDAAGRRVAVTDPLGQTTATAYDAAGRRVAVTNAVGETTAFRYDAAGQRVETTWPDGATVKTEFDALGRPVAQVDPAGVRTEFVYDALDRLIEVKDALGGQARYGYDEIGGLVHRTDANGHAVRFERDALGRPTKRTLADGTSERFRYDVAGNLVSRTDSTGAATAFSYDALDRVVRRTAPDGSTVDFTYTANHRRATVTDERGTTVYGYDARDRLTSVTTPEGWIVRSQWDGAGRRTAVVADLGELGVHTTARSYDAAGRLTTVTDAHGGVYRYAYDAAGRPATLEHPHGVTTSFRYDPGGDLMGLETVNSEGEVLQAYRYTLGATNRRRAVEELDGTTRSWDHDPLYRLIGERVSSADGSLVREQRFTYDAVGNRLAEELMLGDGTTATTVSTYDARDRLLTETTGESVTTYGWDASGNLVSKTAGELTTTYLWDSEDQLTGVRLPDGTEVDHRYDAAGVRVATTVSRPGDEAVTTHRVVDTTSLRSQLLAEINGAEITGGELTAQYPRGHHLLAVLRSGGNRYVHTDALGSVRTLTDPSAEVSDRYVYAAFGALLDHQGDDPTPLLFRGEPRDEASGLVDLRARWLSPATGSFLSMDPASPRPYLPLDLATYLYAHGDPVNRFDPLGRQSIADVTATLNTIGNLSRVSLRVLRVLDRVQSVVDMINLAQFLFNTVTNGGLLTLLEESMEVLTDPFPPGAWGRFTLRDATDSLSVNLNKILGKVIGKPYWPLWLARNSRRIRSLGLHLPSPVGRGAVPPIKTGVRVGRFPLNLVLGGGDGGSLTGVSLITNHPGSRIKGIWRLDFHQWHQGRGIGRTNLNRDEISVWTDFPFHYHVLLPPN